MRKGGYDAPLLSQEQNMTKENTTPIMLLADYWPQESDGSDNRVEAGSVIDVTIDVAMTLIEEGKAKRADPLVGR